MGSTPVGISGSRAAAILGLSEWQTQVECWQRLCEERRPGFNAERGYVMPPDPDNAAIRWGSAFEDAIVELAEAKAGRKIGAREKLFTIDFDGSGGGGPITCHLDGGYHDGDPGLWSVIHEGKTTTLFGFSDSWGEPGTDRIPQHYQVQVQHQMLCTGASEAIVSVLAFPRRPEEWEKEDFTASPDGFVWRHEDDDERRICVSTCGEWAETMAQMGLFFQYPVAAAPELHRTMLDAYAHFWATYVIPEREPEAGSYEDVRRLFPAPVGTLVVSEQEERWLAEHKEIGKEISPAGRLGKRRDELKVLILQSARARGGAVPDDESAAKLVFRNAAGKKMGSYDGKTFR